MERIKARLTHMEGVGYSVEYLEGDFQPKMFNYDDPSSMDAVVDDIKQYAKENMLEFVNISDFPEFNTGDVEMVQCTDCGVHETLNTKQAWRILESLRATYGQTSEQYLALEDIILEHVNFEKAEDNFSDVVVKNINEALNTHKILKESFMLLEMDLFDVRRRDILSFKDFTKACDNVHNLQPKKGQKNYLKGYTREITRHKLFTHPSFDSTYGAVEKSQAKPKPVKKKDAEKPAFDKKKNKSFDQSPEPKN